MTLFQQHLRRVPSKEWFPAFLAALTPRQRELADLMADGRNITEIADAMRCTRARIYQQRKQLTAKIVRAVRRKL